MLTSLRIQSFKAFDDVTVQLSPLTVLVGANGMGKSTVLQAVELLGGLTRSTVSEHLEMWGWDYADLPHLKARDHRFGVTGQVKLPDQPATEWSVTLETRRRPGIREEYVQVFEPAGDEECWTRILDRKGRKMMRREVGEWEHVEQTLTSSWLATVEPKYDEGRFPVLSSLASWARGIRGYFFLNPLFMRGSSRETQDDIGRYGDALAGAVRFIEQKHPEALSRLERRVRRYYPQLVSIRTLRKKAGWTELKITEKWGRHEIQFNARQVSDGLLRLIAVSVLHELEEPPRVVLFDEIENGVHPRLLGAVVEVLQEFVDDQQGRSQVIMTTHSPIALNYIRDPHQVLVVHRDSKSGSATVTPLDETPRFSELRPYFDLGELWYNAGEQRLVGKDSKR